MAAALHARDRQGAHRATAVGGGHRGQGQAHHGPGRHQPAQPAPAQLDHGHPRRRRQPDDEEGSAHPGRLGQGPGRLPQGDVAQGLAPEGPAGHQALGQRQGGGEAQQAGRPHPGAGAHRGGGAGQGHEAGLDHRGQKAPGQVELGHPGERGHVPGEAGGQAGHDPGPGRQSRQAPGQQAQAGRAQGPGPPRGDGQGHEDAGQQRGDQDPAPAEAGGEGTGRAGPGGVGAGGERGRRHGGEAGRRGAQEVARSGSFWRSSRTGANRSPRRSTRSTTAVASWRAGAGSPPATAATSSQVRGQDTVGVGMARSE